MNGSAIRRLRKEQQVTLEEMAERTGISVTSLSRMEGSKRAITIEQLDAMAKALGVATTAFFQGPSIVPVAGYIGAGAEIHSDYEQVPPEGLQEIEVPFPLPADMSAFQVRGDSMLPRFRNGDAVIVFTEQRRPLHTFFGEEAAVRLSDGRRFVKEIVRNGDGVMLLSTNARPITDVDIEWVGEIFTIIPSTQLQRAWLRNGK